MIELLQKLVEAPGPSGYETQVRGTVRAEVEALARQVVVDGLGSLLVYTGEKQAGGRRILVSAHMDEPGVIVTEVDPRGFARVTPLGSLSVRACLGHSARFLNGASGVFVSGSLDDKKELTFENLYIDLGCKNADECPVKLGDTAVLAAPFLQLNGRLCGKSLDNRAGVAVVIELARRMQAASAARTDEIVFVFNAQEKVGMRGLGAAAFGLQPDLALIVDATAAGDMPRGPSTPISLGKGPVIHVRDEHMIVDPAIVAWARQSAEAAGIPYQIGLQAERSGARAVQLARDGIWTCAISLPCRYMGTGSEMVDLEDFENTIRLAQALLDNPFGQQQ